MLVRPFQFRESGTPDRATSHIASGRYSVDSSLLAKLMHEISGLIRETRIESLSQEGRPRASLDGHRRIAEAVRRQDGWEASRAMADHIRLVSDVALIRDGD